MRATYELEPSGRAGSLAVQASVGMEGGPDGVRGRVVEEHDGRAVLEFPAANWQGNVPLLVSSLVAGEGGEMAAFTRCRLVDLDLPGGYLPGPRFGLTDPGRVDVGVILKPSLGLTPAEASEVAAAAIRGGARFIKDDEMLGDPPFCPLDERVRAIAGVLEGGVVYCANVTGPSASLLERAHRVVALGATGVLVNAFAQGVDSVLALRDTGPPVPILAHRAGSGPIARNDRFGATGAVLARLARLCGADYVIVGGFGGKLFETDGEVRANIDAVRGGCGSAPPSVPVIGGAVGADNAGAQVHAAGGPNLVVVLGSRAYVNGLRGLETAVRRTVEAVAVAVAR